MEKLKIAGVEFNSRLFLGTGKFSSNENMRKSIEASGTEMVTVAMKRIDTKEPATEPDGTVGGDPAPDTKAPDGDDTEGESEKPKKGCKSSVGVSVTLLLTLCGCWLALSKKQKH